MTKKNVVTKYEKILAILEEKRLEYKEAFDMFDSLKTGKITAEQIYNVMRNMGNELPLQEIKGMIAELDADGSGEIDFEEFITFMQMTQNTEELTDEEEVIRAFQSFDKDGNGWLSNEEFKHILCNLGDKFTEAECNEIFKEADMNNDGKLEYREFVNFWKNR